MAMNPLSCPCPAPPGCVWASCSSPWSTGGDSHLPQHTVGWWPWGPGSPSPLTSCSPMRPPAAVQASALPASLPLLWLCPGEAPAWLPSSLSTPQVPAGLYTQWPVEHRLIPIRPQMRSLESGGSSLHVAAGAGWEAGGCPCVEIPWDGQQAQAAEQIGVCKERNTTGGEAALSARQVLGLEGPSCLEA